MPLSKSGSMECKLDSVPEIKLNSVADIETAITSIVREVTKETESNGCNENNDSDSNMDEVDCMDICNKDPKSIVVIFSTTNGNEDVSGIVWKSTDGNCVMDSKTSVSET